MQYYKQGDLAKAFHPRAMGVVYIGRLVQGTRSGWFVDFDAACYKAENGRYKTRIHVPHDHVVGLVGVNKPATNV